MSEQQQVLTVSELNGFIKDILENVPPLSNIMVRGELSNYKIYPSGHHYFTLKDGDSALKCVMFKGNAMRLRFRPQRTSFAVYRNDNPQLTRFRPDQTPKATYWPPRTPPAGRPRRRGCPDRRASRDR